MTDDTAMTLHNPIHPNFGHLIYTVTDAAGKRVPLNVPYQGSVRHPTSPASGPWTVSATLGTFSALDQTATGPSVVFVDANAAVTLQLTPVATLPPEPAPGRADFPPSLTLPYTNQYQQQSNWCWAAVTSGVSAYFRGTSPVEQGLLANHFFLQSACSIDGNQWSCNRPFYLDVSLAFAGCLHGQPIVQPVGWDVVRTQIAGQCPLAIGIAPTSGGTGHALCIVGYDDNSQTPDPMPTIDVADPWMGLWRLPFADFPNNLYQGLSWNLTCLTQAPSAQ